MHELKKKKSYNCIFCNDTIYPSKTINKYITLFMKIIVKTLLNSIYTYYENYIFLTL